MALKNILPNELGISRIYDAPVKKVWEAWTDPAQAAKWWGPRGFTITTKSKDLKAGGHWEYIMHGPDGVDYPNRTYYYEVIPNSRLVYDHGANDSQPPLFKVTVDFNEVDGRTHMDMRMTFATPEIASDLKKFIKSANGDSTWDRLAEYLSDSISGKDIFVINRSFETSLENLYEVWTDPKHSTKWNGPAGFKVEYLKCNIIPGGELFYYMAPPDGPKSYGKVKYLEVIKPTYLSYIQMFSDENEGITRHPAAPTWPLQMLTKVSFIKESENQTRITLQWEIYGDSNETEVATFKNAKAGMMMGWTGSFDKLEVYLKIQNNIHKFDVKNIKGESIRLDHYKGSVLLVVNVASECGLTPQYEALEKIYEKYHNKGFEVLGFPANEFGAQEPGTDAEIQTFCTSRFGVKFPMFSKIVVKGPGQHPLYGCLTNAIPKATLLNGNKFEEKLGTYGIKRTQPNDILWNFEKFLIGKNGEILERFAPDVTPDADIVVSAIERALKA